MTSSCFPLLFCVSMSLWFRTESIWIIIRWTVSLMDRGAAVLLTVKVRTLLLIQCKTRVPNTVNPECGANVALNIKSRSRQSLFMGNMMKVMIAELKLFFHSLFNEIRLRLKSFISFTIWVSFKLLNCALNVIKSLLIYRIDGCQRWEMSQWWIPTSRRESISRITHSCCVFLFAVCQRTLDSREMSRDVKVVSCSIQLITTAEICELQLF